MRSRHIALSFRDFFLRFHYFRRFRTGHPTNSSLRVGAPSVTLGTARTFDCRRGRSSCDMQEVRLDFLNALGGNGAIVT